MKILMTFVAHAQIDIDIKNPTTAKIKVDAVKSLAQALCIDPANPGAPIDGQDAVDFRTIALAYLLDAEWQKAKLALENIGSAPTQEPGLA